MENFMDQPPQEQLPRQFKMRATSDQDMMGDLAMCIIEFLNTDSQNEEEPFEQYAHQLRTRFQRNNKIFCTHFIQGYAVLLEQLQLGD